MNRLNEVQTHKRDNLLVDLIFQHKGKENPVSSKELADYLAKKGYKFTPQSVNTMVTRVKFERKLPICSSNCKGYYWATSKADITSTIEDLQSRIADLQKHIDFLNSFIIN